MHPQTQPQTTTATITNIQQVSQTNITLQPDQWLWLERVPLAGLTLVNGDHNSGKTRLAMEIAACVSSGRPMPDGLPTIQSSVIIVSNNISPAIQRQRLAALGADLSRIEILSFVESPASESHPAGTHPFSLPEDFTHLFEVADRINARLIIFDPFITLLSRKQRCTLESLCNLLIDLNQQLIERNIACLLIRSCPGQGGHARPSVLEKSDYFTTIAVSCLLLARDPFVPNRLLLTHAKNHYGDTLSPTLIIPIPSQASYHPHITVQGTHSLQAEDFMENRPDTLHRELLSQNLLELITEAQESISATKLHSFVPHCTIFQIHRSLKDLIDASMIKRDPSGLYTTVLAPASHLYTPPTPKPTTSPNPTPQPAHILNSTPTIDPTPQSITSLNPSPTIIPMPLPANHLNSTPIIDPTPQPTDSLNPSPTIIPTPQPANHLNSTPTIDPIPQSITSLNTSPTIIPAPQLANHLNPTPAIDHTPQSITSLNPSLTTNTSPQLPTPLNPTPTIDSSPQPPTPLASTDRPILIAKPANRPPCGHWHHAQECQCHMN